MCVCVCLCVFKDVFWHPCSLFSPLSARAYFFDHIEAFTSFLFSVFNFHFPSFLLRLSRHVKSMRMYFTASGSRCTYTHKLDLNVISRFNSLNNIFFHLRTFLTCYFICSFARSLVVGGVPWLVVAQKWTEAMVLNTTMPASAILPGTWMDG